MTVKKRIFKLPSIVLTVCVVASLVSCTPVKNSIEEYSDQSDATLEAKYRDEAGRSHLHLAVMKCNYTRANDLLNIGAIASDIDNAGNNAFYYAIKNEYECHKQGLSQKKLLLKMSDAISNEGEPIKEIAHKLLVTSVGNKTATSTIALISLGASLTGTHDINQKLLEKLSKKGVDFVKPILIALSDYGVSVDVVDESSNKLLILSILSDNSKLTEWLINFGADVNTRNKNGTTPLRLAILRCNIEVAEYILDSNNLNKPLSNKRKNNLFRSAMNTSIKCKKEARWQLVKLLLSFKIYPSANFEYNDLIERSFYFKDERITLALADAFQHSADIKWPNESFYQSFLRVDKTFFEKLMGGGFGHFFNINYIFEYSSGSISAGDSLLLNAIRSTRYEMAELLIEAGADVNYLRQDQQNAVMLSVVRNNHHLLKLLLSKGASIQTRGADGLSVLMQSQSVISNEMIDLAIDNGVDPNAVNNNGYNALYFQYLYLHAAGSSPSAARHLIKRGADPHYKDAKGLSFVDYIRSSDRLKLIFNDLHMSNLDITDNRLMVKIIRDGQINTVQQAVKQGLNINDFIGLSKETPLHVASRYNHVDIMRYLIVQGANIDIKVKNYDTPLTAAAFSGAKKAYRLLIRKGANINRTGQLGYTPLHVLAMKRNRSNLIEESIQQGSILDIQDTRGKTPLHYSVQFNIPANTKALLNNGADTSIKNNEGVTPLHIAVRGGKNEIVELLVRYSADIHIKDSLQQSPLDYARLAGNTTMVALLLGELGGEENSDIYNDLFSKYNEIVLKLMIDIESLDNKVKKFKSNAKQKIDHSTDYRQLLIEKDQCHKRRDTIDKVRHTLRSDLSNHRGKINKDITKLLIEYRQHESDYRKKIQTTVDLNKHKMNFMRQEIIKQKQKTQDLHKLERKIQDGISTMNYIYKSLYRSC